MRSQRVVTAWGLLMAGALAASAQGEPPVAAACFAPGTPWPVIEEYAQRLRGLDISLAAPEGPGFQFADGDRWTRTVTSGGGLGQGAPTIITWSVVPDGTSIFGYAGEPTADSDLIARLNSLYGNRATWILLFQQVFDRWSELTGITYVYEPNDDGADMTSTNLPDGQIGVRGDVRICGHFLDGDFGVLAYNFGPDLSEMIIDSSDGYFNDTSLNSLNLRNTVAHEHGHGLGFQHVCPVIETKLMEPVLSRRYDGPQHDDFLAGNRGYGDRLETNDTSATADDIGTLTPGTPLTVADLSIDDNSDAGDFLSFQISVSSIVTITMTPTGSSYANAPQNSSTGNCDPSTTFDSLRQHNLGVELRDRNGMTVLASANTGGLGVPETISGFSLTTPGRYFVRVFGTTTNAAQFYDLRLQSSASNLPVLTVSKTMTPLTVGPLPVGSTVEYTISVENTGVATATNVVITDCLAPQWDPVGITVLDGGALNSPPPAPAGCPGNWVKWTLGGPLVPSGLAAVRFQATIPYGVADATLINNTAAVMSSETSLQSSSPIQFSVCAPRLIVAKAQDQPSYRPGDTVNWTLTVRNTHGQCPVSAVSLADAIDLTLVEDAPTLTWTDPPGFTSSKLADTITWTSPSLAAGATAVMTVSSRVRATASGMLCNDAESEWSESLTPALSNQTCATIATCPLAGVPRVTDLKARRAPGVSDVELQWSVVSGAEEYDLWRVEETKSAIPSAARGASAPVFGVAGCASPAPTMSTTCVDPGVVPAGTLHFYQVRGACGGSEGAI